MNGVPLRYIDRTAHGDFISRVVNDIDQVSDGLLQGFTQLFTGIITIVGTLVFMLMANVWVALLVFVLTPLSLFVASFIAKNSYKHFRGQTAIQGELSGYVEEMVANQKPSMRSTPGFMSRGRRRSSSPPFPIPAPGSSTPWCMRRWG